MQPGLIWSNPNSDYLIVCRAPHDCVTRKKKQGSRSAWLSPQSMIHYARKLFGCFIRIVQSVKILETTRWPYDPMTRWPDDQMTRWPDDQLTYWQDDQITILTRLPYDQMIRWQDDQMTISTRWTDDQMTKWSHWTNDHIDQMAILTIWPYWPDDQKTILTIWPDDQMTRRTDDDMTILTKWPYYHINQMTIFIKWPDDHIDKMTRWPYWQDDQMTRWQGYQLIRWPSWQDHKIYDDLTIVMYRNIIKTSVNYCLQKCHHCTQSWHVISHTTYNDDIWWSDHSDV